MDMYQKGLQQILSNEILGKAREEHIKLVYRTVENISRSGLPQEEKDEKLIERARRVSVVCKCLGGYEEIQPFLHGILFPVIERTGLSGLESELAEIVNSSPTLTELIMSCGLPEQIINPETTYIIGERLYEIFPEIMNEEILTRLSNADIIKTSIERIDGKDVRVAKGRDLLHYMEFRKEKGIFAYLIKKVEEETKTPLPKRIIDYNVRKGYFKHYVERKGGNLGLRIYDKEKEKKLNEEKLYKLVQEIRRIMSKYRGIIDLAKETDLITSMGLVEGGVPTELHGTLGDVQSRRNKRNEEIFGFPVEKVRALLPYLREKHPEVSTQDLEMVLSVL